MESIYNSDSKKTELNISDWVEFIAALKLISETTEFLEFYQSPNTTDNSIKKVIMSTISDATKTEIPSAMSSFLDTILKNKRVGIVPDILDILTSKGSNNEQVEVYTPYRLTDKQLSELKFPNPTVIKQQHINKSLLAGIRVTNGNQSLDLSISQSIKQFSSHITK